MLLLPVVALVPAFESRCGESLTVFAETKEPIASGAFVAWVSGIRIECESTKGKGAEVFSRQKCKAFTVREEGEEPIL